MHNQMKSQIKPRLPHQSALRKGRWSCPNHCYFVTIAVAGRRPILANPPAARIVLDCLCWLQNEGTIRLMGFVVMPDHVHFAFVLEPTTSRPGGRSYDHGETVEARVGAATRPRQGGGVSVGASFRPRLSLADIVRRYKSYTAHRINEVLGLSDPLWQPAYHDHLVRDRKDFEIRLNYMHGNPVRKGLAHFEHDYEFSTANQKFASLIDWSWVDGIGDGRGREPAPTKQPASERSLGRGQEPAPTGQPS